jgi:signal transduction histidine kinase
MAEFTVDTKLFRELGELLVGRDSTAVVELVKNSYDADATKVTIFGENLGDPKKGSIIVEDDGIGMDIEDFERGFLRIAGRTKNTNDRRSPWFKRRFTGEKGVGRLAAHKLARNLEVISRKWNGSKRNPLVGFPTSEGVRATIDWDEVEKLETLAHVAKSKSVTTHVLPQQEIKGRAAGTRLILKKLRRAWDSRLLDTFFREVITLTPPPALVDPLPKSLIDQKTILPVIAVRDAQREAGFKIEFAGEFSLREPDIAGSAESAAWVIEIECDADTRMLRLAVMPTKATRRELPKAEGFQLKRKLDANLPSIGFQARILQRQHTAWPNALAGIRVYYEGFRVLPYGDSSDDWLNLDQDYRSRGRGELGRLRRYSSWKLPEGDPNETLTLQGNKMWFGAVFLTRQHAGDLQMLVNREGFLPGPTFDFIIEMVRLGIDLQIRQNYSARAVLTKARKIDQQRQERAAAASSPSEAPTSHLVNNLQSDALGSLRKARAALARGDTKTAGETLSSVERTISSAKELVGENASEATMYRVLASMGLEQAAFIHEVNALAVLSQGVAQSLDELAKSTKEQKLSRRISAVAKDSRDIRDRLRRNAVYLADMTGIEGRRRRSRQSLVQRFEKVLDFYRPSISKSGIDVRVSIPSATKTPAMFPAEVSAIFSNLLSNAIKFAGERGIIKVSAAIDDGELIIRIENTGDAVDLRMGDKWFEPFRSSTSEVDESLGQGMGLGLTVTRSLLEEYGGAIQFVEPSKGFATALEIRIPA